MAAMLVSRLFGGLCIVVAGGATIQSLSLVGSEIMETRGNFQERIEKVAGSALLAIGLIIAFCIPIASVGWVVLSQNIDLYSEAFKAVHVIGRFFTG